MPGGDRDEQQLCAGDLPRRVGVGVDLQAAVPQPAHARGACRSGPRPSHPGPPGPSGPARRPAGCAAAAASTAGRSRPTPIRAGPRCARAGRTGTARRAAGRPATRPGRPGRRRGLWPGSAPPRRRTPPRRPRPASGSGSPRSTGGPARPGSAVRSPDRRPGTAGRRAGGRGQPGLLTRIAGGPHGPAAIRLAVASASGEITNRLPARVSAFSCHQPNGFASPRNINNAQPRAAQTPGMRTYRELFRTPEFTPLFLTSLGPGGGLDGRAGWRLGTLVYAGHRFAAAVRAGHVRALARPAHRGDHAAVGGRPAAAAGRADRRLPWCSRWAPPCWPFPGCPCGRRSPSSWASAWSPRWAAACATGCSTRSFRRDSYLLGRSVLNMSVGAMQICGFAVGGMLVAILSAARHAAGRRRPLPRRRGHRLARAQPPAAARRRAAVGPPDLAEQRAAVVQPCRAATCISRCGCRTG